MTVVACESLAVTTVLVIFTNEDHVGRKLLKASVKFGFIDTYELVR